MLVYRLSLLLILLLFRAVVAFDYSNCTHYDLRQEIDSPGMHILCILPDANGHISVSVLVNSITEKEYIYKANRGNIENFLEHMHSTVGTSNFRPARKWKAFNTRGQELYSIDSLLYHKTAIVQTNGLWRWPGVREGYTQTTVDGVTLTTLSVRPLVLKVQNFLSYDECDRIKGLSERHMVSSKTSKMDKDKG